MHKWHKLVQPRPPTRRAQNPALRHELSFEMGQVHSDMALHFGNPENPRKPRQGDPTVDTKPVFPSKHQHFPLKARGEMQF